MVGQPADLVGHSDGAVVALQVAMQRPERVKRLVLISGGFNKSGAAMPDIAWDGEQVTQFLGPAYGEVSPDGEAHFPVVAEKIGVLTATEPNLSAAELSAVTARSLVMFSDDDLMTLTHAVDMYDALPNAELAIVPGTSHFLTQEKPQTTTPSGLPAARVASHWPTYLADHSAAEARRSEDLWLEAGDGFGTRSLVRDDRRGWEQAVTERVVGMVMSVDHRAYRRRRDRRDSVEVGARAALSRAG